MNHYKNILTQIYFGGSIKILPKKKYWSVSRRGRTNFKEQGVTEEVARLITDYVEELKELLSLELWDNIFLNCTKNEVLVFWLLYRKNEANMTEIAEYIHVPLNTATGIIQRMEKNGLVVRRRSEDDKRVVNIGFSEKGMTQFEALISEIIFYVMKVVGAFTKEEMDLFYRIMAKVIQVLRLEQKQKKAPGKVRKITIE